MQKMETAQDLMDSINMTNNGYLFAPTPAELAIAQKNTGLFSIRRGQIHKYGVACEHPAPPQKIDWRNFDEHQPDYEGAILARQDARWGY